MSESNNMEQLSQADLAAMDRALNDASTVVNSVIAAWGRFVGENPPGASTRDKMNYLTQRVLSWGEPSLTVDELRSSITPYRDLPNMPPGSHPFLNQFISYLQATASVGRIQQKMASQLK